MLSGQVNFPATGVGTASNAIPVTISNTRPAVSLDSLALTASAGFKLSGNTCGTALAAGATCTTSVVFAPSNPSAQTGTLTVASSALGANATVPLSGTGFDFSIAGAGPQTVASGQTANYTLTLTPTGGVPLAITFQCASPRTYAGCLFNPSTNSVAATATGTEMVQITTSQASGIAAPAPGMRGWKAVVLACGLVLLPLAARKRRRLLASVALLADPRGGLSEAGLRRSCDRLYLRFGTTSKFLPGEVLIMSAKVTLKDVERVAELAHLELSLEETPGMVSDLNAILDYMAELNELDTRGVAPLAQVSELEGAGWQGALRPDIVQSSLDRAQVMAEAPETDGAFFKVPKVIER